METKKVLIGSLYEFSHEALAETIEDYRENLPPSTTKPFISYDERTALFSFTCERTDITAVSTFFGGVKGYVDIFEKKRSEDFVGTSPKIKPMKGTIIEDNLMLDGADASGEDLLSIGEDVDSDLEEAEIVHNHPYWAPQVENSQILTRDIASGVAEATEADLYPEHDRNRVVIMGGNTSEALSKLTTLEPLMVHDPYTFHSVNITEIQQQLLAQQRCEGGTNPSANVLMQLSLDDLSTLDVKPILNCPLAVERVIIDQRRRKYIEHKCIITLLHRHERHGPWITPVNMTTKAIRDMATSSQGFSQIWTELYPSFGEPTSAKPAEAFSATSLPVPPTKKFVTASKAHDIGKWNEEIADCVNPEEIAVEAPSETGSFEQRKRKVREDSDEDDAEEENVVVASIVGRQRRVASSDDEGEEDKKPSSPILTAETAEVPLRPTGTSDSASASRKGSLPSCPPSFLSLPEFDLNNYRKVSQPTSCPRGRPRIFRGMGPPHGAMARGTRVGLGELPHPASRGTHNARGRAFPGQRLKVRPRDLVDLSTGMTTSSKHTQLPPGLDIRIQNAIPIPPFSPEIILLDEPLENLQMPSIRPEPAVSGYYHGPQSAGAQKSSNVSPRSSGAGYVNTYNPPLDIAKRENDTLAELRRMQAEGKERRKLTNEAEKRVSWGDNKTKQKHDELSTRRVFDTVKQQAPEPSNNGKLVGKKLNESERREKLNEIYGEPILSSAPPRAVSSRHIDVEKMSNRKKQALKKVPERDPVAAAKIAEKQLSSKQATKLIEYLNPLFDVGRAFRGDLKFELQLGQVLIVNSKNLVTANVQYTSLKQWEKCFSTSADTDIPLATTFTNLLTRNGHDIDRLLKIKPPGSVERHGPTKLFDGNKPGPTSIVYEFHCQSRESEEFWIAVDADGKYRTRKNSSTLGSVNLHYPASIWDARATLLGTGHFCEPEGSVALVGASFMKSVFIPGNEKISITYRQPAENDMTVRSVTVKRASLHDCLLMGREEYQLQITEVKALFHRFHQQDKNLIQSFEKDYQEMFDSDRIHYEVSLVHKGINEALKQNRTLEIGNLTDAFTTGESLLGTHTMENMLELVSYVVAKINWAGIHNNGTLLRMMQEQEELQARVANTVLSGSGPAPSVTGLTSAAGTRIRSTIPGVRMNTLAELGKDADGNLVFIGLGGAKIPIVESDQNETNVPGSEVAPDDSASNIESERSMPYIASATYARGLAARGKNFW